MEYLNSCVIDIATSMSALSKVKKKKKKSQKTPNLIKHEA